MTRVTRAELYLREGVPMAASTEQSRILGRLQALVAAGVIRDLQVRCWPRRVTVGDGRARREFALCREFEAWAEEHGTHLAPAFDRHECHNGFTGHEYTTTVLPVVCLAFYDNEDLIAIYPHTGEHGIRTVLDGLSVLEADALSRGGGTDTRPTPDPRRRA